MGKCFTHDQVVSICGISGEQFCTVDSRGIFSITQPQTCKIKGLWSLEQVWMAHLHSFAYTHTNPQSSLLTYFFRKHGFTFFLCIFSFSFLSSSSPTQSLAQILHGVKEYSQNIKIKLQTAMFDGLVPAKTALQGSWPQWCQANQTGRDPRSGGWWVRVGLPETGCT